KQLLELRQTSTTPVSWMSRTRHADRKLGVGGRLLLSLNKLLHQPHDETVLRSAFKANWDSLKRQLDKVRKAIPTTVTRSPAPPSGPLPTPPPAPSEQSGPKLSPLATDQLLKATKGDGAFHWTHSMYGYDFYVARVQLLKHATPRDLAHYRGAVDELLAAGLVRDDHALARDHGHFSLTAAGWKLGEELPKQQA